MPRDRWVRWALTMRLAWISMGWHIEPYRISAENGKALSHGWQGLRQAGKDVLTRSANQFHLASLLNKFAIMFFKTGCPFFVRANMLLR
jgi:hypothetical protein